MHRVKPGRRHLILRPTQNEPLKLCYTDGWRASRKLTPVSGVPNLLGLVGRIFRSVGEWLSLVEHLVRDQGVGGSNPLSPTNLLYNLCLDHNPPEALFVS
jgi:hypothetical protein